MFQPLLGPGVHRSIPYDQYNSHPAMRSTMLKILLKGQPADLKVALESPWKSDSDALLRGDVLHTMLLEPFLESQKFVYESTKLVGSKAAKKENNGCKEDWDQLKKLANDGLKKLVPYDIYSACIGMAESVRESQDWQRVERFADKELTLIADIDGVRVKVRLDAYFRGLIVDLKTTSGGLSEREIMNTIVEYEYPLSAAMYCAVADELGLPADCFRWIFIQSKPPHQWVVVDAEPELLKRGTMEFKKTLEIYRMAAETDIWPGYFGDRRKTGLPDWYKKRTYSWGQFDDSTEK